MDRALMRILGVLGVLLLVVTANIPSTALAQLTAPAATPETKAAVDPLGRTTPRGTVEGYLEAIRQSDIGKASQYLDVNNVPLPKRKATRLERAKQLIQLLDRNGYINDIDDLSAAEDGEVTDGLPSGVDQVGVLDRTTRKVPLLVHQVNGPDGLKIWQFEPATLNRVPFLLTTSEESLLDRVLPENLKSAKVGQVSSGHWIAIGFAAVVALAIGLLISATLVFLIRKLLERRQHIPGRVPLTSILIPLGVVIGVSLYRLIVVSIGVQLVARDYISWLATIASLLALAWLGVRIIDGIADIARYGMSRTKRLSSVAVIMLARRIAKAIILGIVAITILDIVGFDVSTGLAALGIGGIALALGAQRTIENLVGSITVVADRPVSVGDFCKFGEVMGTIEDIGIRSTQVRTLDRTIVTVPNGAFASMQIENYSRRDEFRFYTVLTMRYETTPAQIRFLLAEIKSMFDSHELVNPDPARVRFVGLGSHSIDIELFCYVRADDWNHFLVLREDMLLKIMEIVAQSGTDFAFPSQTLYFGKDHPPSPEQAQEIDKIVQKMDQRTGEQQA